MSVPLGPAASKPPTKLSRIQRRRERVKARLRLNPEWSDRKISEHVGVSRELVKQVRHDFFGGAPQGKREGRDGKQYTMSRVLRKAGGAISDHAGRLNGDRVIEYVPHDIRCPDCEGSGLETCTLCAGHGFVSADLRSLRLAVIELRRLEADCFPELLALAHSVHRMCSSYIDHSLDYLRDASASAIVKADRATALAQQIRVLNGEFPLGSPPGGD